MIIVKYRGFNGQITRTFTTMERAIEWARMCGVYGFCTFIEKPAKN